MEREEKKLRHSATRDRIYGYLLSTKAHPSAEMIYSALKDESSNLSLGTVYRNLKQLEAMGKVVRVTSLNDKERYDAFCEDHVHFVCQLCGSVTDMPQTDMAAICMACKASEGMRLDRVSLVLRGVCADCNH